VVVVVFVELVHLPHNAGHNRTASSRAKSFGLVQAAPVLNNEPKHTSSSLIPLQNPVVVVVIVVAVVVIVVAVAVLVVVIVSVVKVMVDVIDVVMAVGVVVVVDVVATHVPQSTGQWVTKNAESLVLPSKGSQNPGTTLAHLSIGSSTPLHLELQSVQPADGPMLASLVPINPSSMVPRRAQLKWQSEGYVTPEAK
jgi:hypothetical protein